MIHYIGLTNYVCKRTILVAKRNIPARSISSTRWQLWNRYSREKIIDHPVSSSRSITCLFNPARVHTAVLWMRAADWFTVLYVCERGETAQPYLSEPTAGYHCAVAHPDNPTRAGPIDMLMAGLVAWNCHPVCIVRSNSASLGSALFTARFPRHRQRASTQSYRQSRRFARFLTAKFSIFKPR